MVRGRNNADCRRRSRGPEPHAPTKDIPRDRDHSGGHDPELSESNAARMTLKRSERQAAVQASDREGDAEPDPGSTSRRKLDGRRWRRLIRHDLALGPDRHRLRARASTSDHRHHRLTRSSGSGLCGSVIVWLVCAPLGSYLHGNRSDAGPLLDLGPVGDRVEPVDLVEHNHVERRRGRRCPPRPRASAQPLLVSLDFISYISYISYMSNRFDGLGGDAHG